MGYFGGPGEREGKEEHFNERKTKMKVLQNLTAISNHKIIKNVTAKLLLSINSCVFYLPFLSSFPVLVLLYHQVCLVRWFSTWVHSFSPNYANFMRKKTDVISKTDFLFIIIIL